MTLGKQILLFTPWMKEPGTQLMVEAFTALAAKQGWHTDLWQDTRRFHQELADLVATGQQPDAIVVNVSPETIRSTLEIAQMAGIPVVGMDADQSSLLLSNISSDAYAMAAVTASYIAGAVQSGGGGRVVLMAYDDYLPVQKRRVVAQAILENTETLAVARVIIPDVATGSFESARAQMIEVLAENPEPGSIRAVWAAWDEPGLGALAAIEALNRQDEGILITGVDATPPALKAIARGSNFQATVKQDFTGIAQMVADVLLRYFDGETAINAVYSVPVEFIDRESSVSSAER